jgi:hypothetical protein
MKRVIRVKTEKEFNNKLDDLMFAGYKVDGLGRAVKKNYGGILGHFILFILFGWWLLLIPNLIYALTRDNDEIQVVLDKEE